MRTIYSIKPPRTLRHSVKNTETKKYRSSETKNFINNYYTLWALWRILLWTKIRSRNCSDCYVVIFSVFIFSMFSEKHNNSKTVTFFGINMFWASGSQSLFQPSPCSLGMHDS